MNKQKTGDSSGQPRDLAAAAAAAVDNPKLGCTKCRHSLKGCARCKSKKGKQVDDPSQQSPTGGLQHGTALLVDNALPQAPPEVRATGQSSIHRFPSHANTSAPQQPATPQMQTSAANHRSADHSTKERFPKLPHVFHAVLNHMLKEQPPKGHGDILPSQSKGCKTGRPWFHRFFRSQSRVLNEKGVVSMPSYYFAPWHFGIENISMFEHLSALPSAMLPTYHTHFLQQVLLTRTSFAQH